MPRIVIGIRWRYRAGMIATSTVPAHYGSVESSTNSVWAQGPLVGEEKNNLVVKLVSWTDTSQAELASSIRCHNRRRLPFRFSGDLGLGIISTPSFSPILH